MADPAASITAFMKMGADVAFALFRLSSELRLAGQEARTMGAEIRDLCTVLEGLRATLSNVENAPYFQYCQKLVKEMRECSSDMFKEIFNITKSLSENSAKTGSQTSTWLKVCGRVHWFLKKSEVERARLQLEGYKTSLNLLLATIQIAGNTSRSPPRLVRRLHVNKIPY